MPERTPAMHQPLISIVVAVYNAAKTLQQCIDSIAGQTYPAIDLVIIDGGSKDATLDIVKANERHVASWISEPDNGVYSAWNKGLQRVRGDWVCFLGADDFLWNENVLRDMVEALQGFSPAVRLVYGQVMLLNHEGQALYPIGEPWQSVRHRFMQVMCIPHPGLMHRRSLFEDRGSFDESFRIGGDYELMLRELKTAEAAFVPGIVTVGMRQGGISSVPENAVDAMKEARRAQKMHGLGGLRLAWVSALLRVYLRMLLWRTLGENKARRCIDWGRRLRGLPPYWTKTS